MNKKILIAILLAVTSLFVFFKCTWFFTDEWSIKNKEIDIHVPIENSHICELDYQIRHLPIFSKKSLVLGRVLMSTEVNDEITTKKTLTFEYSTNTAYSDERFIRYDVIVNMITNEILYIKKYGSNQLGGFSDNLDVSNIKHFDDYLQILHVDQNIQTDYLSKKSYTIYIQFNIFGNSCTVYSPNTNKFITFNL